MAVHNYNHAKDLMNQMLALNVKQDTLVDCLMNIIESRGDSFGDRSGGAPQDDRGTLH